MHRIPGLRWRCPQWIPAYAGMTLGVYCVMRADGV